MTEILIKKNTQNWCSERERKTLLKCTGPQVYKVKEKICIQRYYTVLENEGLQKPWGELYVKQVSLRLCYSFVGADGEQAVCANLFLTGNPPQSHNIKILSRLQNKTAKQRVRLRDCKKKKSLTITSSSKQGFAIFTNVSWKPNPSALSHNFRR